MRLIISNRQRRIKLDKDIKTALKSVVKITLLKVRKSTDYEISLTLVDNKEIIKLNALYRNIDRPTDVLSFALEEGTRMEMPEDALPMLGEIVISVEKAMEQADEF